MKISIKGTKKIQKSMIEQLRSNIVIENSEFLKDKSYFEFGVFSGDSMLQIYHMYKKYIGGNSKFYGFDSFLGLPEEKIDVNNPSYWTIGNDKFLDFNQNSNIPQSLLDKEDIIIVDGWFDKTLTPEFASTIDQKIGLLHIDCDIYTSSYQALDFCFKYDLLEKGTIIMYDDWGGYLEKLGPGHDFEAGEGLAHKEIMEKYNRKCHFKDKHIIIDGLYEIAIFILE